MSSNSVCRSHYDEIEFDDQLALKNNAPFTGVIYANYDNGQSEIEFNYTDGLPSGIQRRWLSNGQLEEEWNAIRGKGSIWSRKWYPNGVMKYERTNEGNLPPRIKEWSEDGTLLRDNSQPA
jgi:antitoxin component YwqK of YwqJK toxin-antitoxin module